MADNKVTVMTCVTCPIGCTITAEQDAEGNVISVKGNTCKRGEAYAKTELTAPMRSLTSTVKVRGGRHPVVPVKSRTPVPKARMFDIMAEIAKVTVDAPVAAGQTVIADVLGTGVDIITEDSM